MASPTRKLRDPKWQTALDRATPFLDKFQARIQVISDDLRALEKILTDSAYRVDTRVQVPHAEQLGWVEYANSWRICTIERDMLDGEETCRPLIETPVATRWRASQAIPLLLAEIARTAAGQSGDQPGERVDAPNDDDIPF